MQPPLKVAVFLGVINIPLKASVFLDYFRWQD